MGAGDIVKTYRSKDEIAFEINAIKANVVRTAMLGAIDVGRLLCEAKEVVPHGEWGAWLEENVSYSQTTANDLMRIYREYNDDQIKLFGRSNEELYGALSTSQALALLALPAPAREAFVETHDMGEISVRELRAEIDAMKAELERANAEREAAEGERDLAKKLHDAAEERERAAKASVTATVSDAEKKQKAAEAKLAKAQKEAEKAKKDAEAARAKLAASEERAEQLQVALDEKPAPAVVEKIVEQLPADYEALKEDKARLEKQLMLSDKAVSRFGLLLEELQRTHAALCGELEAVESPDVREKLRAALGRVVASFGGADA